MTDLHRVPGDELTAAELYALLKLRVDIFVVEQEAPYPELDGRDLLPHTVHFWVQPDDEPLAYLRVLAEPGGGARIGRVCTMHKARGMGLGSRLMAAALEELGDTEIVLDAQVYAQAMYAKFGFRPVGEEFLEDGIPHITMKR